MGDTFALGSDDVISLVDPPQQHVAEVNRPDPSSTSSRPTGCCLSALARNSSRFFKRMVPALVTRLTRKWPGYSTGGSVPLYARGEGRYSVAGGRSCSAS